MRKTSTNKSGFSLHSRRLTILLAFLLVVVFNIQAQEKVVTGVVKSGEDSELLPGVTVLEKGTTNGTITDLDGKFQLRVGEDAVLSISFVGFRTQEIVVGNQSSINVVLDIDVSTLEEVVVVGYGTMRKMDMTSAHTSIGAKEISQTVNTTLEQAIQGRSPGVYITQNTGAPGGGLSVNIRGVNSINGTNEPLYVVDGVQIQGEASPDGTNPLANLNPSDIESIEILKGPSATAIYGSRATNGVVMITTKRGASGEMQISYGYQYSLQTAPQPLEVMNMRQYAQMENEYKERAGGTVREEFLDPSILGEGTNWQDELFSSAPWQKHQVSLSGGGDKTRYYISGEYLDQEGVALGSGFDRYSMRLNLDSKPREWLSLSGNFNFAQTDERISTTQSNVITTAIQLAPHIPVRNIDGSYGGGTVTQENSSEQFSPPNPIGIASITINDETRRQFLGGFTVSMDIIEGLVFRSSLNGNFGFSNSTYFLPTYKFGYQENVEAILNNNHNLNTYWNWNQTIQYTKVFGGNDARHTLTAMATHEAQESTWKNLFAERRGFQTNDVIDLNAGDESLDDTGGGQGDWAMESYLGRINYNFADRYIVQANIRADGSVNFGSQNKWGVFPSVSGAWRVSAEPFFNVPFFSDLKLRYETGLTGSQGSGGAIYGTLAASPSEWGTSFRPNRYPNPNYGWEETLTNNFGLNIGLLNDRVQIEADYYIKSTDNLILVNQLPWYMGTQGQGNIQAPTVNIGSLENRGWEFTLSTVNIAKGSFQWTTALNISHFKAELTSLTAASSHLDKINWWMNDWTQRSVVGESPWLFYGYIEEGIFQSIEELENSALPADNNGNEYPIAENSIWVGDVKYRDVNGDGVITGEDQTFIGNPWPKLFAGFTNNFSYKGITLNVLITGTYGNEVYNYLRNQNTNPNNINLGRNLFIDAFDYAKVEYPVDDVAEQQPFLSNPDTKVARISGGNNNNNFERHTDKYVEDGSYIRLKNITLSYALPANIIQTLRYIRGARVGFSAQNVYTLTNYSGYDPEVGSYVGPNASVSNAAIGVDYGRYPITPIYSINVGIDF